MRFSDRILKTIELLEPGDCLADIGCDHGYMSILAAQRGMFRKIYAADVRKFPLQKALVNIRSCGCDGKVTAILSNGFQNIPSDAEQAVICGMGGLLIRNILIDAAETFPVLKQLILGPHSEAKELRAWILSGSCYRIYRETVVKDGGKYYCLMDVRPMGSETVASGKSTDDPACIAFGSPDLQTDNASYLDYLTFQFEKRQNILSDLKRNASEAGNGRLTELETEVRYLRMLLESVSD